MSVTFEPAWPVPYRTAPPVDLDRLYRQALFMGTRQPPNMVAANGGHCFPKPRPYLERNRDIVRACDRLVGCPKETVEPSPGRDQGTWSTVRYARRTGVPVTILWP